MKLMVSSMLSAAIKRQYRSVLHLRHRSPVFDEICETTMNLVYIFSTRFWPVTLKIVNTRLDRSAALVNLVLSVII